MSAPMTKMTDEFGFSIDLTVRSEWRNIDLLRTSVQNCFTAVFADVENALKYGDWVRGDRAVFRLRVTGHDGGIAVSVQNPLKDDTQAANLVKTIEWIASFAKPEQAYRARMLQIAQEDSDTTPSRLGLVRIAFEGNCRLDAKVDGNAVTVTATLALDQAAAG